ncbi:hypothetical protein CL614_08125 [archaeon]|nr:hypothetical protein [archaeon]
MAQNIKNKVFGGDVFDWLKQKIALRQELAKSSDFGEAVQNVTDKYGAPSSYVRNFPDGGVGRAPKDILADLSSRTPIARMWTAVKIFEDMPVYGADGTPKIIDGDEEIAKWNNDKKTVEEMADNFLKQIPGQKNKFEEHKWSALNINARRIYEVGNHKLNTLPIGPNQSTFRNSSTWHQANPNLAGIMPGEQETDMNKFLKPPAGITSISSETDGPLGVIKKTTVNFIVHNFSDFERIYLRYFLKPGAHVFIDFGWDTAKLYNPETLLEDPNEIYNKLYGPTGYVTLSKGDLETSFGYVTNYDAKNRDDGGFDCSIEIVSRNTAILSAVVDDDFKDKITNKLDLTILALAASGRTCNPVYYYLARQHGKNAETAEQIKESIKHAMENVLHISTKRPGFHYDVEAQKASELGICFRNNSNDIYVSFGWLEDNFLNIEFGFSDNVNDLSNVSKDAAENDFKKLFSKYNSKNSFATWDRTLVNRMNDQLSAPKKAGKLIKHIMYPEHWGKGDANWDGKTYSIYNGMVPDRYNGDEIIDDPKYGEWEDEDKREEKIPLRELFISIQLIKDAISDSQDISGIIKHILKTIKNVTDNIIDLDIASDSISNHTVSFVDKNFLGRSKTPENWETPEEFIKKLLLFSPYSKGTIVKEYALSFSMPKQGLGNILAIQSSGVNNMKGLNNIQNSSVLELVKSFTSFEIMNQKKGVNKGNGDVENLANKFIKYEPAAGLQPTTRFNEKLMGGLSNFVGTEIYQQQMKGSIGMGANILETSTMSSFDGNFRARLEELYKIAGASDAPTTEETLEMQKYLEEMAPPVKADQSFLEKAGDIVVKFTDTVKSYFPYLLGPWAVAVRDNAPEIKHTAKAGLEGAGKLILGEWHPSEEEAEGGPVNILTLLRSTYTKVPNLDAYWKAIGLEGQIEKIAPLIQIEANLTIYGISGFFPGNLIAINYLPENYRNNAYFQIMKVSHEIGDTWTTSFTTQMRVATEVGEGENNATYRIDKNYLSTYKFPNFDPYLQMFGDLKPIILNSGKNGDTPLNIQIVYECVVVDVSNVGVGKEFGTVIWGLNANLDFLYDTDKEKGVVKDLPLPVIYGKDGKYEKPEYVEEAMKDLQALYDNLSTTSRQPKVKLKSIWGVDKERNLESEYGRGYGCLPLISNWAVRTKFYIVIGRDGLWTISPINPANEIAWRPIDKLFGLSTVSPPASISEDTGTGDPSPLRDGDNKSLGGVSKKEHDINVQKFTEASSGGAPPSNIDGGSTDKKIKETAEKVLEKELNITPRAIRKGGKSSSAGTYLDNIQEVQEPEHKIPEFKWGCMDPTMDNYDPQATHDDGNLCKNRPEHPSVPVASEDEFFDEDITIEDTKMDEFGEWDQPPPMRPNVPLEPEDEFATSDEEAEIRGEEMWQKEADWEEPPPYTPDEKFPGRQTHGFDKSSTPQVDIQDTSAGCKTEAMFIPETNIQMMPCNYHPEASSDDGCDWGTTLCKTIDGNPSSCGPVPQIQQLCESVEDQGWISGRDPQSSESHSLQMGQGNWIYWDGSTGNPNQKTTCETKVWISKVYACQDTKTWVDAATRKCEVGMCENSILQSRGISNPNDWLCCPAHE